ncbi:MAG: glycosyl hydrolase family 28-related protein [Niabella sp.]
MKFLFIFSLIFVCLVAYTQPPQNYHRVSKWFDGTIMNDSKIDGVVYKKENGSYYKIDNIGSVNIKWFGAVGDGKTNDTKAIQKAIDLLYSINKPENVTGGWLCGGGIIIIPSGRYRIDRLILRDNIILEGEDKTSTLLISNQPICITNVTEKIGAKLMMSQNVKINNLFITGGGIEMIGAYDSKIQNSKIFNTPIGITLGLTVNLVIEDVQVYNCKKGIYFNGHVGNGLSTTLKINNLWVAHCSQYGMDIDMAVNNKLVTTSVRNSIFEYCDRGINIIGSTEQLIFDNIHFEGNKISNLSSGDKSSFYARDIWSDSSPINIGGKNTQRSFITLENVMSKLNIDPLFGGTIYVKGCTQFTLPKSGINYEVKTD